MVLHLRKSHRFTRYKETRQPRNEGLRRGFFSTLGHADSPAKEQVR